VAEGALYVDGLVTADRKLTKYDATYMPLEAAEALKVQGDRQTGAAPFGNQPHSPHRGTSLAQRTRSPGPQAQAVGKTRRHAPKAERRGLIPIKTRPHGLD
jgi:hypothetical protein